MEKNNLDKRLQLLKLVIDDHGIDKVIGKFMRVWNRWVDCYQMLNAKRLIKKLDDSSN